MPDIVIVAGGRCSLPEHEELMKGAFLIGADRGALYLAEEGYRADLAVGDFDSVMEDEMKTISGNSDEILRLPSEKDETDLEAALRRALSLEGAIHILGATGTRLDQTFSALDLLKVCHDRCRVAFIYDSSNRIRLVKGHAVIRKSRYRYVSLIPYGDGTATVSLRGFKYSGEHISLGRGTSLGISNEIAGDAAEIETDTCLFVFESDD